MIILDTDHLTLLQWGGEPAQRVERRLALGGYNKAFPTSIVSYEEQFRGWAGKLAAAKTVTDEVRLYEKLHANLLFFATLEVIKFTEKAATEFQRLRAMKVRIGTMDLKIAAIALANDATIFTRNLQDFSKVPGLRAEDASV